MRTKLLAVFAAIMAFAASSLQAAPPSHVEWTAKTEQTAPGKGVLILTGVIEPGWHIYGTEMPDLGDVTGVPEPTYIVLDSEGVKPVDMLECDTEPTMHLDELMNLNLPWLSGTITLRQAFELDGVDGALVTGAVKYMACTEQSCTAPTKYEFSVPFGDRKSGV